MNGTQNGAAPSLGVRVSTRSCLMRVGTRVSSLARTRPPGMGWLALPTKAVSVHPFSSQHQWKSLASTHQCCHTPCDTAPACVAAARKRDHPRRCAVGKGADLMTPTK